MRVPVTSPTDHFCVRLTCSCHKIYIKPGAAAVPGMCRINQPDRIKGNPVHSVSNVNVYIMLQPGPVAGNIREGQSCHPHTGPDTILHHGKIIDRKNFRCLFAGCQYQTKHSEPYGYEQSLFHTLNSLLSYSSQKAVYYDWPYRQD